jgi:hypothetical protein
VRIKKIPINRKNQICPFKLNTRLPRLLLVRGGRKRIKIERPKKTTPSNLFGMDRKIAYAKRKYHSGTM